ncbi:MAG: hypothetical protein WCV89_00915 [Candidatus Paceibacterota bacterium]|jgi:hypothetical protein
MATKKRGNAYNENAAIEGAMARCGCSWEKFAACAEKLGQSETGLANWIGVTSPAKVRERMSCPL